MFDQSLNQINKVLHQDLYDDAIGLKRHHSEKFEVHLQHRTSHVFTMLKVSEQRAEDL
jgi:hypothetical protein